ncbi:MAG: VWA domain-containing protein [Alloprevotella sp.]
MFRFANPEYLALLTVPAVMVGVFLVSRINRRRRLNRLSDERLADVLTQSVSPGKRLAKFILVEVALTALVLAIARPQMGTKTVTNERTGIEVCFVIDVSNSMRADDVSPSRLERAKLLVSTLLQRMKHDRVALAVFAGEAYPQLPITNDYASARLFLDNFTPGMVTLQGTSMASAINLGRKSFTENKEIGKAIVIITDGEDHEEGAIEAAAEAKAEDKCVYVLGVGSPKGSKIPMPEGGNLRDKEGREVVSALNENICRQVATAGGGAYFHIDNSNTAQEQLQSAFAGLKQADTSSSFTDQDEQFMAVALIALALLVAEELLIDVRRRRISKKDKTNTNA